MSWYHPIPTNFTIPSTFSFTRACVSCCVIIHSQVNTCMPLCASIRVVLIALARLQPSHCMLLNAYTAMTPKMDCPQVLSITMACCKTEVTPLLTHCSYCSLVMSRSFCRNWLISQIPQYTCPISHNTLCAHFCYEWCIVGYETGVFIGICEIGLLGKCHKTVSD